LSANTQKKTKHHKRTKKKVNLTTPQPNILEPTSQGGTKQNTGKKVSTPKTKRNPNPGPNRKPQEPANPSNYTKKRPQTLKCYTPPRTTYSTPPRTPLPLPVNKTEPDPVSSRYRVRESSKSPP